MAYEVTLSISARRDLEDIVRYISIDSPERALEFGRLLVVKAERLGQYPELGKIVSEFGRDDIREIIIRSYRVIYRVDHGHQKVQIIRFWHGRRGLPTIS